MSASLLDDGGSIAGLVGVAVMETMGIIENVGAGADAGHVASISNDRDMFWELDRRLDMQASLSACSRKANMDRERPFYARLI